MSFRHVSLQWRHFVEVKHRDTQQTIVILKLTSLGILTPFRMKDAFEKK